MRGALRVGGRAPRHARHEQAAQDLGLQHPGLEGLGDGGSGGDVAGERRGHVARHRGGALAPRGPHQRQVARGDVAEALAVQRQALARELLVDMVQREPDAARLEAPRRALRQRRAEALEEGGPARGVVVARGLGHHHRQVHRQLRIRQAHEAQRGLAHVVLLAIRERRGLRAARLHAPAGSDVVFELHRGEPLGAQRHALRLQHRQQAQAVALA